VKPLRGKRNRPEISKGEIHVFLNSAPLRLDGSRRREVYLASAGPLEEVWSPFSGDRTSLPVGRRNPLAGGRRTGMQPPDCQGFGFDIWRLSDPDRSAGGILRRCWTAVRQASVRPQAVGRTVARTTSISLPAANGSAPSLGAVSRTDPHTCWRRLRFGC
jgi:hypothetical protein